VEHPCVLSLARTLERAGTPVTVVPVDRSGLVDPEVFRAALGPDVALAAAMRANNETGVLLPVAELAALAREAGAPFLCDAVQAVGKIEVDVRTLGADMVLATGQKLGGPRGAGVLWIAPGLSVAPLLGGEQERGRRAGTENLPGIAGLGAAIEAAVSRRAEEAERVGALRDRLEVGLLAAVPRTRVNGAGVPRLPGTSSVVFEGCDAEALLMAMDLDGVCASAGSACHSGSTRPSGVLLAMGLSDEEARSTIRFSLGWTTRADDVEGALAIVPPLVERVRREIIP
jgi:cysteine desulfurase